MQQFIESPNQIYAIEDPPGDKSISHRAILLNSIAVGNSHVSNFCEGDDRESMLRCLRGLGINIVKHYSCSVTRDDECFYIEGRGHEPLDKPSTVLNAGNSGTTMRLTTGLLAAQPFSSVITGDSSLRNRPMLRIVDPLTRMGASITGRSDRTLAPLAINGNTLQGIEYEMPISSAQVKSAILIASLYASGQTTIVQPSISRDHTERMISAMGGNINIEGLNITIKCSKLSAKNIRVPGDISGAMAWIVAACCHPNAKIKLPKIGINPTRSGAIQILKTMGANIKTENHKIEDGEPIADIIAESSELKATEISGDSIPKAIDEIPLLSLAACFAEGTTIIRDAQELRVKESDRLHATVTELSKFGAQIEETTDGLIINGTKSLIGTECYSHGDHRIAMALGIAGMLASGSTTVSGADASDISYPTFWQTIERLCHRRTPL